MLKRTVSLRITTITIAVPKVICSLCKKGKKYNENNNNYIHDTINYDLSNRFFFSIIDKTSQNRVETPLRFIINLTLEKEINFEIDTA